ncbi:MAG TPA: hypothetical protein VE377_07875 [Candidatus Dormibacteraeota bacterium]|nr:hypothetical protein [Candidatus Dormibacteraeota bacterium]
MKLLCLLCVLCGASLCFSLDREAFSITNYDLNLQIEPEQHRLGVRGKITLRNDTSTPQKIAVLQISSSLNWRSIKAGDKAVQYVTQPYASDIDHTGSLSEAIVTLPQEVAPHAAIVLDIAYEGVVLLDATRLTRIGTPEDAARSSDWDQIDPKFTGLRGAGYVAWYPIATEVANLSDGNSLFEVLSRWKAREVGSSAHLKIGLSGESADAPPMLLVNQPSCHILTLELSRAQRVTADCTYPSLGADAPTVVVARYGEVDRPSITVYNLPSHAAAAETYADTAEKVIPLISEWFGTPHEKPKAADLPDPSAAAFESGALLLTPLATSDAKLAGVAAAHQLTHASFYSSRPWIEEGLAHFAQALYLEQEKGRQAALDYMALHRSALTQVEPSSVAPRSEDEASHSLVNTTSEELYRSKAMSVWWMLRDMIGDAAIKKALASYKPEDDNDPAYMQRLISAQSPRDLQWFFDDWVYRDRGLPDFKVVSAFAAKTPTKSVMVTVTVENLGTAAAEVPLIIKFAGGEVTKRLEVHAKDKATIRVEVPTPPQQVIVNDGSVPESDTTNNTFKVDAPQS